MAAAKDAAYTRLAYGLPPQGCWLCSTGFSSNNNNQHNQLLWVATQSRIVIMEMARVLTALIVNSRRNRNMSSKSSSNRSSNSNSKYQ